MLGIPFPTSLAARHLPRYLNKESRIDISNMNHIFPGRVVLEPDACEKMHMTATLTKWNEERGRHEIFTGGNKVKLGSTEHHLVLKEEVVTNESPDDLEQLGMVKDARKERLRARAERLKPGEENFRMAKLYREFALKAQPVPELVRIELGAKCSRPRVPEKL